VAGHEDDPQYVQAVRARVTELGLEERVEWRGEVPREEIPRLLLEHDVFVYPSIGVESGWLGVLEGLAAGRLVVTSAPGAPRELVEDGINALLFDPNNPRDLAHALARVSSDQHLRLALRSGARETALGHSLEAMTGAIEALVDERVRHGCGDSKPSGAKSRSSGVVG
jgi:glycosyltransferase involved in cell wall biosynthesis